MLKAWYALFPAWAGVILRLEDAISAGEPFPRMGGGDPDFSAYLLV